MALSVREEGKMEVIEAPSELNILLCMFSIVYNLLFLWIDSGSITVMKLCHIWNG